MTTLNLSVTEAAGAAYENTIGTMTLNNFTSNVNDSENEYYGIYFSSFSLPAGVTVSTAILGVTVASAGSDEPLHTIQAEDTSGAPSYFGSASGYLSGLTKTTASVLWDSADLGAGTNTVHYAPDLVSIVSELSTSYGELTAIGITIQGSATSTRDLALNGDSTLDITYTGGASLLPRMSLLGVG